MEFIKYLYVFFLCFRLVSFIWILIRNLLCISFVRFNVSGFVLKIMLFGFISQSYLYFMHLQPLGDGHCAYAALHVRPVKQLFPFFRIFPFFCASVEVIKLVQLHKVRKKISSLTLLFSVKALQLAVVVRLVFVGCSVASTFTLCTLSLCSTAYQGKTLFDLFPAKWKMWRRPGKTRKL